MLHQAKAGGLPINDEDISSISYDLDAPCRKPKMEKVANDKRESESTDLIHHSVSWQENADSFSANNPESGMPLVDDQGMLLAQTFEIPAPTDSADAQLA